MSRRNPEMAALEEENKRLRGMPAARAADPGDMPVAGCGDHSCEVGKPPGMATNGGCRCDERTLRRALRWWKRRAAFVEETVRVLKAAPAPGATAEDERAAVVAYLRHEAETNHDEGTPAFEALSSNADWIEGGGHRRPS